MPGTFFLLGVQSEYWQLYVSWKPQRFMCFLPFLNLSDSVCSVLSAFSQRSDQSNI